MLNNEPHSGLFHRLKERRRSDRLGAYRLVLWPPTSRIRPPLNMKMFYVTLVRTSQREVVSDLPMTGSAFCICVSIRIFPLPSCTCKRMPPSPTDPGFLSRILHEDGHILTLNPMTLTLIHLQCICTSLIPKKNPMEVIFS